jgi:heat shock protein HtpX
MQFLKRYGLLVIINIAVIVSLSIVASLLGVSGRFNAQGIQYESLFLFCAVFGFGGAFISLAMSRMMAKLMMRVKVIDPQKPANSTETWLVQTVHRQARQAGLSTMPQVGIYESPDLNAFATGPTRSRALVAVSTGLVNRMDQGAAEAVLGHEVAQVANGDMVTMTLLQGVVNTFAMFFARIVAWFAASQVKEEMRPLVHLLVTIVFEIILIFFGAILVNYFSRLREYRADIGGAKLSTRGNMIAALKTLQAAYGRSPGDTHASLAAYKISGKSKGFLSLFSTHPPLEERIRRLESAGL